MPQEITHTFDPVYDQASKILILGTMPSPKSRKNGFYYGNPQNRFWPVLAEVLSDELPVNNEEKQKFLHKHHIALWDVVHSCSIEGASDGSIRNPVPNDITRVLKAAPIGAVFTTGKKAEELYKRYCLPQTGVQAIYLPSTSPANTGRFPFAELVSAYRCILLYLN
ncbi:DNA-deoxyinosine glycosylase [Acetanaerobacterium elongatum]|uniref:G/U mismatch-specific uracil-DNA glycosylase n=1 Tax=Acetanaerobacterium elongatum TaxID=258515 RepID=A0A1H0D881_9FIRM|nr:DNA-deoxyinosine glycosylase [Acetanaerobacterium elongatum]SDN66414.1 G/U mismatch-specific uracil-DNA glycosylase [Acetanaerobacterium elongatum]